MYGTSVGFGEAMEQGNETIVFHFCGSLTLLDSIVLQHYPFCAEFFLFKPFL